MERHLKAHSSIEKVAALVSPTCELCGEPTRLVALESIPHNDQADLCTYECGLCGHVQATVVNTITAPNGSAHRPDCSMDDLYAKFERLSLEAEDCELIAKLATDLKKRAIFSKLAFQHRAMARDIEALIMDVRRTYADDIFLGRKTQEPFPNEEEPLIR